MFDDPDGGTRGREGGEGPPAPFATANRLDRGVSGQRPEVGIVRTEGEGPSQKKDPLIDQLRERIRFDSLHGRRGSRGRRGRGTRRRGRGRGAGGRDRGR